MSWGWSTDFGKTNVWKTLAVWSKPPSWYSLGQSWSTSIKHALSEILKSWYANVEQVDACLPLLYSVYSAIKEKYDMGLNFSEEKWKLHIFYKSRAHIKVTLLHTNNAKTAEISITNWSRSSADFKSFRSLSNESLDMCTGNMSIFSNVPLLFQLTLQLLLNFVNRWPIHNAT